MAKPAFRMTLTWRDGRKDRLAFCSDCGLPDLSELAVWRLTGKFPPKTTEKTATAATVTAQ